MDCGTKESPLCSAGCSRFREMWRQGQIGEVERILRDLEVRQDVPPLALGTGACSFPKSRHGVSVAESGGGRASRLDARCVADSAALRAPCRSAIRGLASQNEDGLTNLTEPAEVESPWLRDGREIVRTCWSRLSGVNDPVVRMKSLTWIGPLSVH